MRPSLVPVLVIAVALPAAFAPSARARFEVEVTSNKGLSIQIFDLPDAESNVSVSKVDGSPAELRVVELSNRALSPGEGCRTAGAGGPFPQPATAFCRLPPLALVTFVGGNGRDRFTLNAGAGDCNCSGSGGNDEIRAADGADFIRGSTGNDVLFGGPGDDVLLGDDGQDTLAGEAGNDDENGGLGIDLYDQGFVPDGADKVVDPGGSFDEISYSKRRGDVAVTLGSGANDGARLPGQLFGERDDISFVASSTITGGSGDDVLIGDGESQRIRGGAGNDDLQGRAGNDTLNGGAGSDLLKGEEGSDQLFTRDAIDDQVNGAISCGPQGDSGDVLEADVRDDDTRPLPADCEQVSQGMVKEDPNVHIRSARRAAGGGLDIGLRCPLKTSRGCAGILAVERIAGKAAHASFGPRVRYSIRRGKRAVVRVPGAIQTGARIRVRSLETGRLGPRTTFQTLTVGR